MTRSIDTIPLDWDLFVERYWDREPVRIRPGGEVPFVADEVFDALVAATRPSATGTLPLNTRIGIGRDLPETPGDLLPTTTDGSLDAYARRMEQHLEGRPYALTVGTFHVFHHPQWARQRAFYAGLWDRVGLPLNPAITSLFHGSYEHSPAGVHRDRFATFMFALEGRKRMRFWPSCPWPGNTTTVLDYEPYLESSFSVEIEPGELLYWPSSYYHVGESDLNTGGRGPGAATSVNVGVPRDVDRSHFDVMDFFHDPRHETLLSTAPDLTPLPRVEGPVMSVAGPALAEELPPALAQALGAFRTETEEHRIRERTGVLSLRRFTSGGFHPVPPPAAPRPLDGSTQVVRVEPVLWTNTGTARLCGAAGHTALTSLAPDHLTHLLAALHSGPVPVMAVVATVPPEERGEALRLLEELESFRAIARSGGS
ncbi:cupin [Streptomyces sp. I05A-00742]|uniref:cupin n=1 Tax=Streptomyces sp. I05A-00742 TaxID=2732853 RepID=UPI001489DB55|nr:cupin [Streptomyces sp. I05A-00742]